MCQFHVQKSDHFPTTPNVGHTEALGCIVKNYKPLCPEGLTVYSLDKGKFQQTRVWAV